MGPGVNLIDVRILNQLSIASILRGRDGTGIAYGRAREKGNKPKIIKENGDALYFDWGLKEDERKQAYSVMNDYFIGHTRWSTAGKDSMDATHPFEFSKLVGAHNGTLYNDYGWQEDGFHNDSEKLYSRINDVGVKAAIQELDVGDSYALTWFDKETCRVNFLRNEKRELFFALHPQREVMYWFSEADGLRWILRRNGVNPETVWEINENLKFSFDPSRITSYHKNKRVPHMQTQVIDPPSVDRKPKKVVHIGSKHHAANVNVAPWADWQEQEALERERMIAAMS